MAAFNAGDRCRGVNYTGQFAFRNGMVGVITGGLELRNSRTVGSVMVTRDYMYEVKWADGTVRCVSPHYLEHLFSTENGEWAKGKVSTMLAGIEDFKDPRQADE